MCNTADEILRPLILDVTKVINMVHAVPEQIHYYPPPSAPPQAEDFLRINVSGQTYVTLRDTLEEFPGTLLGCEERRRHHYVEFLDAYFFDRHRECFEAILYYYQSCGTLFRPSHIPMDVFVQEARFFGISEDVITNLHRLEGYAQAVEKQKTPELPDNKWQRKVWLMMDSPDSGLGARMIGCLSVIIIVVSITTFCLETIPTYHNTMYVGQHPIEHALLVNSSTEAHLSTHHVITAINIIEVTSVTWFCIEYGVRFASSPNKWQFVKSFLNLIDLIAILPFFIVMIVKNEAGSSLAVVRVARLARVFRIFKLSRHSVGLQILGSTLKASLKELCMMLCVICFSVITFSSAIYYAEHEAPGSMFPSIPSAFWYTLVTMTTVGYGDHVPLTIVGKVIGGFCAISGVLTVAMVIPIIVTNFEFFYRKERINVAHEEQKMISLKHSARKQGTFSVPQQQLLSVDS